MPRALQTLERSSNPLCRSLPVRDDHVRTWLNDSDRLTRLRAHNTSTHSVKKIDKRLGFVSMEAPGNSDFGWTAQEGPNVQEAFIRGDLHRVDVGPELDV